MDLQMSSFAVMLYALLLLCTSRKSLSHELEANQSAVLMVDASPQFARQIPDTLFGIFFEHNYVLPNTDSCPSAQLDIGVMLVNMPQSFGTTILGEINHAGAGGIWAELVSNRGFEAGGPNTPSNIDPWSIIGNESFVSVSTDRTSCFRRNIVALRMEVLCDKTGSLVCPADGVGIYNPGYWGMNIEERKTYKVILHVRSFESVNLRVSLTSSDGSQILGSANIITVDSNFSNWRKVELQLESKGTNHNSRLQLTTTSKGTIWFDQVSVMPLDTYKGHGFRKELVSLLADLKPRFFRFPGGCFVEGEWLRNAFRWRETIGPWEERPGHFGDVWMYWTDDGLGYFEFLQLAEDLDAAPIWVFNNGISHNDQVDPTSILPFVQDILDSIEFARGSPDSKWGSVRASMGHPDPFQLYYVAIGNEDCWKRNYRGNYLKFYNAIKDAYPDIKIISNCDGSSRPLDHPADFYDFHVYTSARKLFSMTNQFDVTSRVGPKAFVSEYAVTGSDAGTGSLLASLAEAGFLIGLEKNSDIVEMASYAPLFVNTNDRRWNPDAIVYNSWQQYGTPSYWIQQFFKESSGATIHPTKILSTDSGSLAASAITWKSLIDKSNYLKIKIVNFGSATVDLKISVAGLLYDINSLRSSRTVLTSSNVMDENSFREPNKVVPRQTALPNADTEMDVVISPHSFTSFDLALAQLNYISTM